MTSIELKFLIFALIGIDAVIVFFVAILIRKSRPLNSGKALRDGTKIFESLLTDADKVSSQLRKELGEKHKLIKDLNEKLDDRIMSLNVLLNRADAVLFSYERGPGDVNNTASLKDQEREILRLSREGNDFEKIAQILEVSKGEVKLVLGLKRNLSQAGSAEGAS